MQDKEDLESLRNEALQKIGRNLVNFQKTEAMLKVLVTNNRLAGPIDELGEIKRRKAKAVSKRSMGELASRYTRTMLVDDKASSLPDDLPDDVTYASFAFGFEGGEEQKRAMKKQLKELVRQRNDLVHHRLVKFNPDSADDCRVLIEELDVQREALIPLADSLRRTIRDFLEALKTHTEFAESREFKAAVKNLDQEG